MAVSNNTSPLIYTVTTGATTGQNIMPISGDGVRLASTPRRLNESDIKKGVFDLPIDRLVDLWLARFGNDWVDLAEIENSDDFFNLVFIRLKQLSELEVHYLTDRARYVCRIPQ